MLRNHLYASTTSAESIVNLLSQACFALAELTAVRIQRYTAAEEYDPEEEDELIVSSCLFAVCMHLLRTLHLPLACSCPMHQHTSTGAGCKLLDATCVEVSCVCLHRPC